MPKKTALLVDGSSLGSRAYYTGNPYELVNMVSKVIVEEAPSALAVTFDNGQLDMRHALWADYKAGRDTTDRESRQAYLFRMDEALRQNGIAVFMHSEGDDALGTLARQAVEQGYAVVILSGDADLMALVDADVQVIYYGKHFNERRKYYARDVQEKYGVLPHRLADYKALCGETSDNIPGVRGIGPKKAVELLALFPGGLEEILDSASKDKLPASCRTKILDGQEMARLSYSLAWIYRDIGITADFTKCPVPRNFSASVAWFRQSGITETQ